MTLLAGLRFQRQIRRNVPRIFAVAIFLAASSVLAYAVVFNSERRVTALTLLLATYGIIGVRQCRKSLTQGIFQPFKALLKWLNTWRLWRACTSAKAVTVLSLVLVFAFLAWLVFNVWGAWHQFRSLFGIIFVYLFGILISNSPAKINWRPVIGGFILQSTLALLFLRYYETFNKFSKTAIEFLDYTYKGTDAAYGMASAPPRICGLNPVFVFKGLQILLYFGAVVAILYYFGVIQAVLSAIATVMRSVFGITSVESLNIVACVFLGTTEACLLVEPLMAQMTASEIHLIMTVGFACISGSLFAIYIGFGACPGHLFSATVMSAAASISISKLLYPETEPLSEKKLQFPKSNGAVHTVRFVWAIGANLVVYTALLALLNAVVTEAGALVGLDGLSFNRLVGYMFFPVTYAIGVSDAEDPNVAFDETLKVAELLGIKTALNEFIAYMELSKMVRTGLLQGKRARMMATFALCGFTNVPTIGVQIGLLSAMCPEQNATFARLAKRSFLAGLLCCLLTTCMAGLLIQPQMCHPTSTKGCLNLADIEDLIRTLNSTKTLQT